MEFFIAQNSPRNIERGDNSISKSPGPNLQLRHFLNFIFFSLIDLGDHLKTIKQPITTQAKHKTFTWIQLNEVLKKVTVKITEASCFPNCPILRFLVLF